MKKLISLLLACIFVFMTCSAALAADTDDGCNCGYTPIIDIKGTSIYKDTTDLSKGLAEKQFSDKSGLASSATKISTALAGALVTDNWDNYCDVLYDEIITVYDGYALNNDGEIANNSGIDPYYSIDNAVARVYENGKNYHIEQKDNILMYEYLYDSRLDPIENAAMLKRYIDAVKEVTGHDKVAILGRCAVCVILNVYLNDYGTDDLESVIFYNSIADGCELIDAWFTGEVKFDSEGLNNYVYEYSGTSPLLDLVIAGVEASEYSGLLGSSTDLLQKIYNKVSSNVVPRLVRDIFGTCPGYYSYVSADKYEKAKSFVLGDNADGKYDKLIAKIDNYNYNYKSKTKETIKKAVADGVHVYIVAKYNRQMYPLIEDSSVLGDDTISLYKQTFSGATCSKTGETLSDEYIASADAKYISPDKMVDASTGILPDHTWYLRDLPHMDYPDTLDPYMMRLLRSEDYVTINTYEDMPQFMLYNKTDSSFTAMTDENAPDATSGRPEKSFFGVLRDIFKKLINLLKSFFAKITGSVN